MVLFKPKKYQLHILSSWFVNLSAGWFISIFVLLHNPFILIITVLLSIMSLTLAFVIEHVSESL